MKKIIVLVLLFTVCSSELFNVTSIKQVDKMILEYENVLLMLNAKWCDICQEIKPMLEKLSVSMQNVTFLLFDISEQQDQELKKIYQEYNIRQFPTFHGFKKTMKQQFRRFKINQKAINSFINSIANINYQLVSSEQLNKLVQQNEVVVTLTIDISNQKHQKIQQMFRQLAYSMKKQAKFYLVDSGQTVNPSLNLRNNPNQLDINFEGKYKLNSLHKFVKANLKQIIAEYDLTTQMDVNRLKFTLLALLENEEQNKQDIQELYDAAELVKKQIPGELIIRYVIKQKLPEEAIEQVYLKIESMSGLERHQVPKLLLLHDHQFDEILYKIDGEFHAQNIIDQVKKARIGDLERIYKTEPIPENQDPFVHKLVHKTFNQFINNTDKDLLIYFHASWSQDCTEFTPKFQKLAQQYKTKNDAVQFAKYDIEKNDYVYELENIPGLVYYNYQAQTYSKIQGELVPNNIIEQIKKYAQQQLEQQKQDL